MEKDPWNEFLFLAQSYSAKPVEIFALLSQIGTRKSMEAIVFLEKSRGPDFVCSVLDSNKDYKKNMREAITSLYKKYGDRLFNVILS